MTKRFKNAFENRCIPAQVIITNIRPNGVEQFTNHVLREGRTASGRRERKEEGEIKDAVWREGGEREREKLVVILR